MICFSLPESAQKARMPSASFSVAMASSFIMKRKVFSSSATFSIFVMVRQINRLKARQPVDATPEQAPETPEDVVLLREIRDSLKHKS